MYQISYNRAWARFYLLMGVFTGLIFISGAVFLKDVSLLLYLLASAYIVGIGVSMHNKPYCYYDLIEIKIYGHFGMLRKVYHFDGPGDVVIQNNRLYINGKKLKLNDWLTDKQDWERIKKFYQSDEENLFGELN